MRSSRHTVVAGAAAALLVSLLFGIGSNPGFWRPGLWHGDLLNPDSFMRMVRLAATLHANAPVDAVARDGSGDGTLLHWSHLVDSLLLLLAAPAAVLVGWQRALDPAAMMFGPLSMAALGAAVAWAAAPFADRQWRWMAAIIACLSTPIVGYGLPGVVHHHVLITAAAVMTAGWAVRAVRGEPAGIELGAWAGVAVWLSPESMPLSLMALCLVWLAWFLRPTPALARCLLLSGLALSAVVIAAWLVDPPAAGLWSAEQDRISVIYVALACAAALCGLAARASWPRWGVACLAGGLAASWLAAFPVLLQGTYGLLPPDVAHIFLDSIGEMQPIVSIGPAVGLLLPAAIAAAWLGVLGVRQRSALLLYAAGCAGLLVLGGAQHIRFAAYPAVLAAALAPVALTALGNTRLRTGLLAAALLLPASGMVIPPAGASSPNDKTCSMQGIQALLAPYAGKVVLADVNDTPELLWRTGVLTVGSLYHRNPTGFMRLLAAWRSVPGQTVPPAVLATRASLILVCPGAKLERVFAEVPGPTLAATLRVGGVPPWLHPVGTAPAGGFVLYAIDRGSAS